MCGSPGGEGLSPAPLSGETGRGRAPFPPCAIRKGFFTPLKDKRNVLSPARKHVSAPASPGREGRSRLAGGCRLPRCPPCWGRRGGMQDRARRDEFLPLGALRSWRRFAALFLLLLALK